MIRHVILLSGFGTECSYNIMCADKDKFLHKLLVINIAGFLIGMLSVYGLAVDW